MNPQMYPYLRSRDGRGGWNAPDGPGMVRISPPTCGTAEGYSCYPGGLGDVTIPSRFDTFGYMLRNPTWMLLFGAAAGALGMSALMAFDVVKLRRRKG